MAVAKNFVVLSQLNRSYRWPTTVENLSDNADKYDSTCCSESGAHELAKTLFESNPRKIYFVAEIRVIVCAKIDVTEIKKEG